MGAATAEELDCKHSISTFVRESKKLGRLEWLKKVREWERSKRAEPGGAK